MTSSTKTPQCKPFSVSVKIFTPDEKKEINFGITKGCNADNTAFWIIDFGLKVKKNNEMKPRVEVHITVGKDKDKEQAEALAALIKSKKELTDSQVNLLRTVIANRASKLSNTAAQTDAELRDLILAILKA